MEPDHTPNVAAIAKENRILAKKLARSEAERMNLETMNRKRESLLKTVIGELQNSQAILEKKSSDLEQAVSELTLMRDKLVEAEKMSALATLVAGIAHEINTPIGTSITLASTLADETLGLANAIAQGNLKRSVFNHYLSVTTESTDLLLANLIRAGELIQSFKQVAVDQVVLELRKFRLKSYLEEVLISLSPHFKKTEHTYSIDGDDTILIESYPGAIAQIATNLVTNSLAHAFGETSAGNIHLIVMRQNNQILMRYSDNGCGIPPQHLSRIFDPFFTTARNRGGTGLGLHIVYNLVTQKLQGSINVESEANIGTRFDILLPNSVSI